MRGACCICGKECCRGYYESDLIYIREAISLGASLKKPKEKCYHPLCFRILQAWLSQKRLQIKQLKEKEDGSSNT